MTGLASALRLLSIPLLSVAVPFGFALWAFPEDLAPVRMIGIVVGWIGCGLLLVSLLLMLREPRLARWLGGLERMYRWHHVTGILAYVALLLHPLALAANGLATSPAFAWAADHRTMVRQRRHRGLQHQDQEPAAFQGSRRAAAEIPDRPAVARALVPQRRGDPGTTRI